MDKEVVIFALRAERDAAARLLDTHAGGTLYAEVLRELLARMNAEIARQIPQPYVDPRHVFHVVGQVFFCMGIDRMFMAHSAEHAEAEVRELYDGYFTPDPDDLTVSEVCINSIEEQPSHNR